MFDLRYHVTSLAAVFIALLIGILVGVALASHGLGNTERKSLEDNVRRAQNRVDRLQAQVDSLNQTSRSNATIDAAAIENLLANRPALAKYASDDQLRNLGKQLGREFVAGNDTPLWNVLRNLIVQEATPRFGASKRTADAVIVVRTADPQTGPTAPFLKGLYEGLADAGVPAAGVAESKSDFPARKVFQQAQLSTVDDVDLEAGRLALAIVLSEPASRADYGVNVPDLLPPVTPVIAASG